MAHVQKPNFVFRWNGRIHLNQRGPQFSWLLAAKACASAVVMLDTPCSEVVWQYWLPIPFTSFPFTSHPVSSCAITFQLGSNTVNPSDVNASQVLSHKIVTNCSSAECAIWNFSRHGLPGCLNCSDSLLLLGVCQCSTGLSPVTNLVKKPLMSRLCRASSRQQMSTLVCFCSCVRSWKPQFVHIFFYWQISEDDVIKSYSTNDYFTLQLISQASNCHDQCGYCTVADVCSVAKWPQLTPFCASSSSMLKLHAQLNTVLHAGAFSPQMADNWWSIYDDLIPSFQSKHTVHLHLW
jgi:hypothetical protein